VERELGNIASALDRYLTAFENGTLDETTCGHRVQALPERATQLTNHHQQIATTADQQVPPIDPTAVTQISHQLTTILHAGTPAQRKAVIETDIAEVRIAHGTITPVFKLPQPAPPA
jgi:site-specific DNA recombinase